MKQSRIRRSIVLASALGAVVSPMLGTMTAAHAVVPAGTTVVAAAGSDTTEKLMSDLQANGYTTSSTVQFFNIPANLKTGVNFTVPGDSATLGCAADTIWSRDPLAPAANTAPTKGVSPFGSGAGRNYLAVENSGTGPNANAANPPTTTPAGADFGCVDVARSSGGPRTTTTGDKLTFEYYAYAMDAVSWATTSLKSPSTLTRQQITDIYDCAVTNWSQVGGTAGGIQRYFPQPGSGTRSFFISDVLVGKPGSYSPPTVAQNAACPSDPKFIEENEGTQISRLDLDKAILPYSAGVWANMESNRINPSLDLRQGAQLKGITTVAPQPVINGTPIQWVGTNNDYELDTAGVVTEANISLNATPNYPGIRYVFNVLDNAGARPGYVAAKGLFGFTNSSGGAKSPLCDNQNSGSAQAVLAQNVLLSNSFAPLGTNDIGGHNVAGATCRLFNVTS